jgi:hypothetical protein
MQNGNRKEPRHLVVGSSVEGQLKLSPGAEGIPISLSDISPTGASITVTGRIDGEMKANIVALVKASKKGNPVPVQLVINNTRIPVSLVNLLGHEKFGVRISDNEKLAVLADRGKKIFNELLEEALKNGAPEAPYASYLILGREFLPPDVRQIVEDETFSPLFLSALGDELAAVIPILKEKIENQSDYLKVAALCQKFLENAGKDVVLKVGAEIAGIIDTAGGRPEALLAPAVRKICSEGRLFSDDKERAAFEEILVTRFFKKKTPANFSELAKENPMVFLINTRFANYDHAQNFYLTLPPFLADFFFNNYLPRASEMYKELDGDKAFLKDTLYRWVHSALNQMNIDQDRTAAGEMEARFKQAMYEFIQVKKAATITPADISRIIEVPRVAPGSDLREKFFKYACGAVEAQVQKKFEKWREEQNRVAVVHEDPAVVEARKIAMTKPLDLMLHNLWERVVQTGLLSQLNKEVAKTFVPKEQSAGILEFGGMVVFDVRAFEEFRKIFPHSFGPDKILDCFDVVDFKKLYQMASDPDVKKKDAAVGLHITAIKPPVLREAIIEKVVNSPAWSEYYVLRKPKSFFEKSVGDGADWRGFIEKNMLTTNPEVHKT